MTDSILTSTKKILGIDETYTAFDPDVLTHINTTFFTLNQLGIGPNDGFAIEDDVPVWSDFIGTDPRLNAVKTYVYLKVRLLFDPPATSFTIDALHKQAEELEWRLNVYREETAWVDPNPPVIDDDDDIFSDEDLESALVFRWDGTNYQPLAYVNDTSRQRWFTGPVDPATLGIVLSTYDQWVDTT